MTPAEAAKLRAPFDPKLIGKLPKPTKADNPKGNCAECGKFHGLPAVHLDYVGHAATTDRLLAVDPNWTWAPMAIGPNGEPLFVNGGLWITLTVLGVTRPGFGDGKTPKEIIGDAIRNAAMRFGVALDLWAKEDLHAAEDSAPSGANEPAATSAGNASPTAAGDSGPNPVESPAAAPYTLTFGKHKGKHLADVPSAYLDWFLENSNDARAKAAIHELRGDVELQSAGLAYDDDDIPF